MQDKVAIVTGGASGIDGAFLNNAFMLEDQ